MCLSYIDLLLNHFLHIVGNLVIFRDILLNLVQLLVQLRLVGLGDIVFLPWENK